jgi:outer membrane lipoprotein SlyB
MTTLSTDTPVTPTTRPPISRTVWMVGGGLAIAAAGVAGGLAMRPAQTELMAPNSMEATKASQASNEKVADAGRTSDKPADGKPVPHKPAQHTSSGSTSTASATTPLATQPAAVCATCGVIEGVREVQQKGKGTGLGAVGGGVVGAAVGNQFGHGNGKAAMTVLGAIGGGLAGNEVEKRARSETVYEVRVRMDDGSLRTLTQKTAPAPGSRVTVDGNTLRAARAPQGGDAQMMRTSASTGT